MTREKMLDDAVIRNIIVYDTSNIMGWVSSRLLKLMTCVNSTKSKIGKIFIEKDSTFLDNHGKWSLYKYVTGHKELWDGLEVIDWPELTIEYTDRLKGSLPSGKTHIILALYEDGSVLLGAY